MKEKYNKLNQRQIDSLIDTEIKRRMANHDERKKIENVLKTMLTINNYSATQKEILYDLLKQLPSATITIPLDNLGTAEITITKKNGNETIKNSFWIKF